MKKVTIQFYQNHFPFGYQGMVRIRQKENTQFDKEFAYALAEIQDYAIKKQWTIHIR